MTRLRALVAWIQALVARMQALVARMQALVVRLQATTPVRAWNRLNDARGGVLAGGIAYFGFFSLIPALTVGFTVFGYVLGGSPSLQQQVAQRVNASVGFDLIGTRPGTGVVQLADLVQPGVLTLTGAFGLVVLIVAGLGWLQASREGIRAVFGVPTMTNPVLARVRDVAALVLIGLAVLASLVAGVVVGTTTGVVNRWLGWDGTPLAEGAVWLGSSVVLLGVDLLIVLLFLTVLSDLPVPVADLRSGAYLAAAGMQILKLSAGLLVQRVSHNPLLASSVVLVGLLVWLNLAARLILFSAAWAAITATDRGHLGAADRPGVSTTDDHDTMGAGLQPQTGRAPGQVRDEEAAMSVELRRTLPSPYARRATPLPPTFGQRSADRVTLAAGIVLGAAALIGLQAVRRALGTVRDAVRG